jgi:hypothetical protein
VFEPQESSSHPLILFVQSILVFNST